MASGVTNRGKKLLLDSFANLEDMSFKVLLATNAVIPDESLNVITDVVEIREGNGYYEGGKSITFGVAVEEDTENRATIVANSVTWQASGGTIPDSGDFARWAILYDNSTKGVIAWYDLASERQLTEGSSLTLQNLNIRLV